MAKKNRRYNPNLIKVKHSYSLAEIAELYKIHPRTAQSWRRTGLKAIDESMWPYLFIGAEIRRFLKEMAQNRKRPLKEGEFYCVKCREPRRSLNNELTIEVTNKKLGKVYKQAFITGICEVCKQPLRLFSSDRKTEELERTGLIIKEHGTLLTGNGDSSLNTDIERGEK